MSFSEELFLLTVQHSHYRNRVAAHNASEALSIIDAIYSDSRNILLSDIERLRELYIPGATDRKNKAFFDQLAETVAAISAVRAIPHEEAIQFIIDDLREFSEYESEFMLDKVFNKAAAESLAATPFALEFAGITAASLYSATMASSVSLGANLNGTLDSFLKNIPASEQRRINEAIKQGFVQGQTNQEIIRSVFNRNNKKSAESVTRHSLRGIVQTATNSMGNQAHKLIAEANEDLVQGYRNVGVWDSRQSATCRSLALKYGDSVHPYDFFRPVPRHPFCRSMIVMALKPWNEVLKTGKVSYENEQGTQSFFAAPTRESSAQITARIRREGFTMDQITKFKQSFSGQTSKATISEFLGEQRDRGNRKFIDVFFGSRERAQFYIDGKFKAEELFDLESNKPIPLRELREIES